MNQLLKMKRSGQFLRKRLLVMSLQEHSMIAELNDNHEPLVGDDQGLDYLG